MVIVAQIWSSVQKLIYSSSLKIDRLIVIKFFVNGLAIYILICTVEPIECWGNVIIKGFSCERIRRNL